MQKIPLMQLKEVLNRNDKRSIRKWCDRNEVFIFERGTKAESVSKLDFDLAADRKFIENLKKKIGEGWPEVYIMYKNGNIKGLTSLNTIISKEKSFKPINSDSKLINQLKSKFNEYAKSIKKK